MDTKATIIKTAEQLFWAQGYKNTSVNQIIEETKLSKGSFFHFFPEKKELLFRVIDYYYDVELKPLFEKHFNSSKDGKRKIIDFCKEINNEYGKMKFRGGCAAGNLSLELSDVDDDIREKLDEFFDKWRDEMIIVLNRLEKEKRLTKSPVAIAQFILWGVEGLTLTSKVHKSKQKNKLEINLFLDILDGFILD